MDVEWNPFANRRHTLQQARKCNSLVPAALRLQIQCNTCIDASQATSVKRMLPAAAGVEMDAHSAVPVQQGTAAVPEARGAGPALLVKYVGRGGWVGGRMMGQQHRAGAGPAPCSTELACTTSRAWLGRVLRAARGRSRARASSWSMLACSRPSARPSAAAGCGTEG